MPKPAATSKSSAKFHLHIENSTRLHEVFEASRKRVRDAVNRHPDLKDRLKITIGYGGDILDKQLPKADALFCHRIDFTNIRERAPRLRWIHIHGAGVEHLMPLDWLPEDMLLMNSSGVHGRRATEYAATAILMLNNRIPELVTHQHARRWQQCFNSSIGGKTLLIVGVGKIGANIARWAKTMDMKVLGIRRTGKPCRNVDEMHTTDKLHKLLPRADFVLVTAPLTKDTDGLMGKKELDLMRNGTGLVNYSRARVVDYDYLRQKCSRGELSAVLDVFSPEPLPKSSPLWRTPNMILTPHCGSDDTNYYTPRTLDMILDNIRRDLTGKKLSNVVDRALQY